MGVTAVRVIERNAVMYRRLWRGSIMLSFVSPVLFLSAMGVGLGSLVQRNSGGVSGYHYLDFIAPALLVASNMQTATNEMAYPVLGKIMWQRIYEAMIATPLATRQIVDGEAAWMAIRLAVTATLYFVVMGLFGTLHLITAPLAVVSGVATGMAFALPVFAFTSTRDRDNDFVILFRFIVLPLFLLSGTFFPISQLPLAGQVVAWLLPLSHGVALARDATLISLSLIDAGHAAVLLAYILGGYMATRHFLGRRLRT